MKRIILAIVLVFIVMTGQAKEKMTVWENPSTEYGTSYGDGFFYLALDVTKVELKANETVVGRSKLLVPLRRRHLSEDRRPALYHCLG